MANSKQFLDLEGLKHVIAKLNARNDGAYLGTALKGAPNGLATLDATGKIPVAQLGNLDVTVFEVVTALPTENIKPHIYLKKKDGTTPDDNRYVEWVYLTTDKKWEEIGEYKADIDLTPYAKLDGINSFTNINTFDKGIICNSGIVANGAVMCSNAISLEAATKAGEDKGIICGTDGSKSANKVWATDGTVKDLSAYDELVSTTWPFQLSSFYPNSYVLEVGSPAALTFNWAYKNNKHTVKTQTLTLTSKTPGDSGTTIGTKSYSTAAGTLKQEAASADLATLCGQRADITAKLVCTSSAGKETNSNATIRAIHPKYWGVLSSKTVPTSATGLTKILEYGSATTLTNVTLANQYLVFMYPVETGFSEIKNITDGSAPYIGAFNTGTTTISGTTYRYYIMDKAGNITWSKLQFLLS